jgi:hypothetical protein
MHELNVVDKILHHATTVKVPLRENSGEKLLFRGLNEGKPRLGEN